jgi:hypothetical protein
MIELDTPETQRADAAQSTLQQLLERRDDYEARAVSGELSAAALASLDDQIALEKMRTSRAAKDAENQRTSLGSVAKIRKAIDGIEKDPALMVDPILDAITAVGAALDRLAAANAHRTAAFDGWVTHLRELGVPADGLTVDDRTVVLTTGNAVGRKVGRISLGAAQVEVIEDVAPYVRPTFRPWTKQELAITPEALTHYDRRDRTPADDWAIKLLHPLGGKPAGTAIRSGDMTPKTAINLVGSGHAELTEGVLPGTENQ